MPTDVFKFMVIRSPQNNDRKKIKSNYVTDDYRIKIENKVQVIDRYLDARDNNSSHGGLLPSSEIGKLLFQKIFCEPNDNLPEVINEGIIQAVLELTTQGAFINCDVPNKMITIQELEINPYIIIDGQYYVLPEKLESVIGNYSQINKAYDLIEKHIEKFDKSVLITELTKILQKILFLMFFQKQDTQMNFHKRKLIFLMRFMLCTSLKGKLL